MAGLVGGFMQGFTAGRQHADTIKENMRRMAEIERDRQREEAAGRLRHLSQTVTDPGWWIATANEPEKREPYFTQVNQDRTTLGLPTIDTWTDPAEELLGKRMSEMIRRTSVGREDPLVLASELVSEFGRDWLVTQYQNPLKAESVAKTGKPPMKVVPGRAPVPAPELAGHVAGGPVSAIVPMESPVSLEETIAQILSPFHEPPMSVEQKIVEIERRQGTIARYRAVNPSWGAPDHPYIRETAELMADPAVGLAQDPASAMSFLMSLGTPQGAEMDWKTVNEAMDNFSSLDPESQQQMLEWLQANPATRGLAAQLAGMPTLRKAQSDGATRTDERVRQSTVLRSLEAERTRQIGDLKLLADRGEDVSDISRAIADTDARIAAARAALASGAAPGGDGLPEDYIPEGEEMTMPQGMGPTGGPLAPATVTLGSPYKLPANLPGRTEAQRIDDARADRNAGGSGEKPDKYGRSEAAAAVAMTGDEKREAGKLGFTTTAILHGPQRIRALVGDRDNPDSKYWETRYMKDADGDETEKTTRVLTEVGKARVREINDSEAKARAGGKEKPSAPVPKSTPKLKAGGNAARNVGDYFNEHKNDRGRNALVYDLRQKYRDYNGIAIGAEIDRLLEKYPPDYKAAVEATRKRSASLREKIDKARELGATDQDIYMEL